MSTASSSTASLSHAPAPISWRSWPLGDGGPGLWLTPIALPAVAMLVRWGSGGWGLAIGVSLLLACSLWQIWIPVFYSVDSMGITRQVLTRRRCLPWSAIGGYELLRTGVVFFLDEESVPLDVIHSMYVPCGKSRDVFLKQVAWYLHDGREPEATAEKPPKSDTSRSKPKHSQTSSVTGSLRVFFNLFRPS